MRDASPPVPRRRIVGLASRSAAPAAPALAPPPSEEPSSGTHRVGVALLEPAARADREPPGTPAPPVARIAAGDVFITDPEALLELLGLDDAPRARRPSRAALRLRLQEEGAARTPPSLEEPVSSLPEDLADGDPPAEPLLPALSEETSLDSDGADAATRRSERDVTALCRAHLAMADAIGRAIEARLVDDIDPLLVRSAARIGLWRAAERFDPARGVPFAAFAKRRILGAIFDELRAARSARPRSPLRAALAAHSAGAASEVATDRESAWLMTWSARLGVHALPGPGGPRLASAICDDGLGTDELLSRQELVAAALRAIRALEPRARKLLERMYIEGLTIEEAAAPLTKSWGSRRHAKAIAHVRRVMLRDGKADRD